MTARAELGRRGENYTARWLEKNGYRIVERNWHSRWGEIDLIAENGEVLAFVEVKTRTAGEPGTPEEAVTAAKQNRLLKTAECYLSFCPIHLQPRFDVASLVVSAEDEPQLVQFRYYKSAFTEG